MSFIPTKQAAFAHIITHYYIIYVLLFMSPREGVPGNPGPPWIRSWFRFVSVSFCRLTLHFVSLLNYRSTVQVFRFVSLSSMFRLFVELSFDCASVCIHALNKTKGRNGSFKRNKTVTCYEYYVQSKLIPDS